jgi:hypothetical protein
MLGGGPHRRAREAGEGAEGAGKGPAPDTQFGTQTVHDTNTEHGTQLPGLGVTHVHTHMHTQGRCSEVGLTGLAARKCGPTPAAASRRDRSNDRMTVGMRPCTTHGTAHAWAKQRYDCTLFAHTCDRNGTDTCLSEAASRWHIARHASEAAESRSQSPTSSMCQQELVEPLGIQLCGTPQRRVPRPRTAHIPHTNINKNTERRTTSRVLPALSGAHPHLEHGRGG